MAFDSFHQHPGQHFTLAFSGQRSFWRLRDDCLTFILIHRTITPASLQTAAANNMAATKNTDASDLATLPSSNDQAEDELTCTLHQLAVATLVEWRAKKKFDPHCLAANEELAVPILAGGLRNMVTTIISVMEAHQLPETMILAQRKDCYRPHPCQIHANTFQRRRRALLRHATRRRRRKISLPNLSIGTQSTKPIAGRKKRSASNYRSARTRPRYSSRARIRSRGRRM
jgi:hypothetical protein